MLQTISLILSVLTNIGFTTIFTIKSIRRKAAAEAEVVEIANEKERIAGYNIIISDLNSRIAEALQQMRKLESEITSWKEKFTQKAEENAALKRENENLKQAIAKLKKHYDNEKK